MSKCITFSASKHNSSQFSNFLQKCSNFKVKYWIYECLIGQKNKTCENNHLDFLLFFSLFHFFQESCDFYISEAERNSSDLVLTKCGLDNLVYDTSVTSSSIVTSFQLSCHRQWILTCIEVLHGVALILGTMAFGLLADWFGRSKTLIFGLAFTSLTGLLAGCTSTGGLVYIFLLNLTNSTI